MVDESKHVETERSRRALFPFATAAPSILSELKLAHEDVALRPLAGAGCN